MRKKTAARRRVMRNMTDAGIVSRYRPAQHVKPRGMVGRVALWLYKKLDRYVDPSKTTYQGSGAASPVTYEWELYAERVERRQIIQDANQICIDDPRVKRSVYKFAREATRQGAVITVTSKTEALQKKGQKIADGIKKWLTPNLLTSWAQMLVIEGDLFVQASIFERQLVKAKRMPAAAMERLTDDTDEFQDPLVAYAQLDVNTNEEVSTFPESLICHLRYDCVDGNRYGQSALQALRRTQKLLEVQENSQVTRRLVRAAMRILWNLGTAENAGDWSAVDKFKEVNGYIEGEKEIYDPATPAVDYYGNGPVTATPIEGDATVHEIADIQYTQNVMSSCLPAHGFLFGLDAAGLNRDVMENLRAEFYKEVQDLSSYMVTLVHWLVETALLLGGVHPDLVSINVQVSDSSTEDPTVVCNRIKGLYQAGLMAFDTAIGALAQFTGVEDVAAEIAKIEQARKAEKESEIALGKSVQVKGTAATAI